MRCVLLKFPRTECDLRCSYCYLRLRKGTAVADGGFLERRLPETIADSLAPERLGGACFFYGYADGEPLLYDANVRLLAALAARGHFVAVTTNLNVPASSRLERAFAPGDRWRVLFLASLHWHEMRRLGRLDAFFGNLDRLREAGFSCRVRLCFAPEYLPELESIDELCLRRTGQLPLLTRWRGTESPGPGMDALDCIGVRSPVYRLQKSAADVPRREFCLAGNRSCVLDLGNGEFRACLAEPVMGILDPDTPGQPLPFPSVPVGRHCRARWCMCCSILWPWGVVPDLFPGPWADLFFAAGDRFVNPRLRAALSVAADDSSGINSNPGDPCP